MKKTLSKTQAKESIETFFQRSSWSSEELKKIKRVAMKYRIKLGDYKTRFCKKCFLPLIGTIRINKVCRTISCGNCKFSNKSVFKNSH